MAIRLIPLILLLLSCAPVFSESPPANKTIQQAVEELGPDDPRKAEIELLSWQIRYWQERLKGLQLEFQGKCYADKRYRTGQNEIDKLTNKIRRLLIP